MIWFLERESDLLICEIRQSPETAVYEYELAPSSGPTEKYSYASASELIDRHLVTQAALQANGWRPKLSDIATLS
jgi:hypothetical protein